MFEGEISMNRNKENRRFIGDPLEFGIISGSVFKEKRTTPMFLETKRGTETKSIRV